MLDAIWNYIKRLMPQKSSNLIVLRKIPFKPTAILDISNAPIVRLLSSNGELLSETDIRQESFKTISEDWSGNYSIVYPSPEEWQSFWIMYKGIL